MFWKSVASALVAGATPLLAFQLGDLWSPKPLYPGSTGVPAPIVDVGYTKYQGYYNSTFDINVYKGYDSHACTRIATTSKERTANVWLEFVMQHPLRDGSCLNHQSGIQKSLVRQWTIHRGVLRLLCWECKQKVLSSSNHPVYF